MYSSLAGHLDHRTSAFVTELLSRWLDDEERYSFIKNIKEWREKIASSDIKWPNFAPYSIGCSIDKVSLVLVPLVASAGVVVSKISESPTLLGPPGKQKLHGLTDYNSLSNKLQSIPGFQTSLSSKEINDNLCHVSAVLFSLPEHMASFFKKISSFKDTNSFQDHHDSFVCRFMISMLISGVNGASLDIKVGEGSFIKNRQEARNFALSLKNACSRMKISTSFILSGMNQPLGQALGNSLEVREALEVLKGKGPLDLLKLALELGTEILLLAKKFSNRIEAKRDLKRKIIKGDALEKFKEIIEAQKGNPRVIDDYSLLPQAKERMKILSPKKGFIHKILMKQICSLFLALGTRGKKPADSIDHGSGFLIFKKIGDRVEKAEILAEVHFNKFKNISWVDKEFQEVFMISEKPPDFEPLIIERIREKLQF